MPGLLDPQQVTMDFAFYVLHLNGSIKTKIIEKSKGNIDIKATSQNKVIELTLIQPAQKNNTGIWMVQKYRYLN